MNQSTIDSARRRTIEMLQRASIVVTNKEKQAIEIADMGLDDLDNIGLEIVVYENNDRYCAKELALFPWQICPEHRHPKISETNIGKQETFRCRWGVVYLYVTGEPVGNPKARVPEKHKPWMTVWHEIVLNPGEQYTLTPNTLHWFQAGPNGAIVSEFSSSSLDEFDVFTDPNIKRV
ncbi:MAG: D-lyxose/D-mannose family sugar isomerase [Bacteroidota bacterium]